MFGFSVWELLLILAIVVLLFGTKKLKSLGTDLGSAIKGFRSELGPAEGSSIAEEKIIDGGASTAPTAKEQKQPDQRV